MSGPPRMKSMDLPDQESRPVLGPAGNNKPRSTKPEKTLKPSVVDDERKGKRSPVVGPRKNVGREASILSSNSSMNASCCSDASTDSSSHSRPSTGGISGRSARRKEQCSLRDGKIEGNGEMVVGVEVDGRVGKRRCAWVTSNTDPSYTAFHDEEWGVPVHDDKKLFELLSFSTALAELSWPVILSKRHIFRDVFLDFDAVAVSKLNEKKFSTPGTPATSLLSEVKLRAIIENARQICEIIVELGSFDKYIWGFVNNKPIVGNFRYPRQVPIKTSKADTISKDLVRRGFRGVGPTVVYSFMQVAGITNDHLVNCFRYKDCIAACDLSDKNEGAMLLKNKAKQPEDIMELELSRDIDDFSLSG